MLINSASFRHQVSVVHAASGDVLEYSVEQILNGGETGSGSASIEFAMHSDDNGDNISWIVILVTNLYFNYAEFICNISLFHFKLLYIFIYIIYFILDHW